MLELHPEKKRNTSLLKTREIALAAFIVIEDVFVRFMMFRC